MNRYRLFPTRSYGSCCIVPHCQMRSGTNSLSQVKTFRLPRDLNRRTAWLKAMNRQDWYPGYSCVVCSRHFIKGCPSRDPDDPDWIPSIFPPERESEKLENRKWKGKRIQKRWKAPKKADDNNRDKPGPSKQKKKPIPKKPADSETTDSDEDDASMGSSSEDPDADVQVVPPPPVHPLPAQLSIPEKEFVLVGKRVVDVNYFVACLKRVNKHHNSMPCGISDMIICEEKVKGAQRGIVFRCKMCLLSSTVWLEDPGASLAVEAATANKNAADEQIRNELYSMSGIKDFILPKPATLPKLPISRKPGGSLPGQSQAPVIVQSHVPLIGYPQVAPVQQSFLSSSGVNATRDGASTPFVELKFCVEDQPIKQEQPTNIKIPVKYTITSKPTRPPSKRIALSPRMISKRHAEYLSSKSAATISKRHAAYLSSKSPATIPERPVSIAPQSGTSILQQQLQGTSTAPKTIILSPGDFQKIFSLSNSLPGQGTTTASVPPRILLNPQTRTLQLQDVQSGPEAAGTSRSILLPPNAFDSSSQSTSGSKNSSSVPETITPDVLPVNLNLVKKEKNETASVQPSRTWSPAIIGPETITPHISATYTFPIDLNLIKKETE